MAKQINVDLRVNADIKQAKANFESLQKTLFKLQESTRIDVKDESLAKAQRAAGDLARNLQQATNVNTGKLDLNKFSSSLNKSGQDLKKLHQQLSSLGPEGEQAFFKLTQSIATADASTLNLGKKLSSLGVVLKNTARWQLSSSLLHGFMGAISGAYRYAQDLNESLNNIRIVTGQNIDQMSQFAKEANNAAKALSTTTTQYTDASLIYYQQGLSDEDVKRRTDATIKLANVSRQSAEEVSSQMTAIWNNFAKGNENLEYYEDVITKLGATTASSSSEIANGLSKFAAVAGTVDLSYEKASAALATVVAETRQSEDIVGTAFKTMFARLEGLNLGKTLEDGVDLNKYSKALEAVGVSILDNNGKIKSMNDILDETGAKWQNIGKEQQIALAQTVAGVRQYTQFIALMDNYDKVLKNEAVAKGSAGTVDEQAKAYAESWEAARDRVTAALETIYQQLLRDDFFIDMLNGAEKFLGVISNVIDGLGGVKGILLLISSIFMQYYAKEMPRVLQSLRDNISVITGTSERRAQALLAKAREELEAMESRNRQMSAVATTTEVTTKMTEALNKARKGLSQTEIEAYEYEIKLAGAIGKTTEELGKEIDLLEKKGRTKANGMARDLSRREGPASDDARTIALNNMKEEMDSVDVDQLKGKKQQLEEEKNKIQDDITEHENNIVKIRNSNKKNKNKNNRIKKEQTIIDNKQESLKETEEELDNIDKLLGGNEAKTKQHHEELKKYYDTFNQYLNKTSKQLFTDLEKAEKRYGKNSVIIEEAQNKIDGLNKKLAKNDLSGATKEAQKYVDKLKTIELPDNISDTLKKELIDGLNDGLEELKSGKGTDKLKEAFENFNQVLESSDMEIEAIQQHLQILGASDEDLKELSRIWEEAGKGSEEFKAKVEEIKNKIEELPQHTVKISEGLTQMASAAMQVSMIINGFQNIGRIFSDEDLSVGEKIIQTMTAVGSMLPMIIALTNKQRIVEMGAVAAKILHIGATNADTAAETASIGAKIASGTAGWYALGPLLLFVAIAAAVVTAIVLITNALIAAANAESEEEKAARLANEELERSKKAAEEAKQAYEDLKSKISSYKSAIETLKECTKGTQEWRDALKEVLNQANDLIQTFPQLLTYKNLFNSDGTLNVEVLEKFQQQAEIGSTAASLSATRAAASKELADYNLKRSQISSQLTEKVKSNTDNMLPEVEATFSNAVNDLLDNVNTIDFNDSKQIKEFIKPYISSVYGDLENYDPTRYSSILSQFFDIIKTIIPDLKKFSTETENITVTMQNQRNALLKTVFDGDIPQDKVLDYQLALQKKSEQLVEQFIVTNGIGYDYVKQHEADNGNKDDVVEMEKDAGGQQLLKVVREYTKLNPSLQIDTNDVFGKENGKWSFFFKDEKGERVVKTFSEVQAFVRDALLLQSKDEIAEMAKNNTAYNNIGSAARNFLANENYLNASISDLENFNRNDYKKAMVTMTDGSEQALQDSNGNWNEEAIKRLLISQGIAENSITKGRIKQWIYNAENGISDVLSEYEEKIPKGLRDIFDNNDIFKNLNIGQAKELSSMYSQMLKNVGEEGAKKILTDLADASASEFNKVIEAIKNKNIDFSNMNVDEANEALSKLGISFKFTENQFYTFRLAIQEVGAITAETAQETLKTVTSILSKLKAEGDIIEDKDYKELLALNPAIESFFTTLADGTHMLTGEVQDFKTAMQTAVKNQLYQAVKNQENLAIKYDNYANLEKAVSAEQLKKQGTVYAAGGAISYFRSSDDDLYNKYRTQVDSAIELLKASSDQANQELGVQLENQAQQGKKLNDVALKAIDSVKALGETNAEFAAQSKKATEEAGKLTEAIKETQYQFDIQNAGLEYETTENYANVLMELYEAEGLSKDAARALSIANQRLDRGLSSLNDNFEKITKSLKNTNKASAEYANTIGSLRKSFADLLNIADGKELSTKWIEKWANDADKMKKILNGDTKAIQEFRESAFTEMTNNVFEEVNESAKNLFDGMTEADGKDIYDALQKLINQLDNGKISAEGLKQELDNIGSTEIGSKAVLSKEYTEALNTMLAQGLLTEQQLNDIFATIGYKPKVTVKDIKQEVNVPIYRTYTKYDNAETAAKGTATGWDDKSIKADASKVTWTEQIGTKKMVQTVPAVQIVSDEAAGGVGEIEVVNAGSMNITPSYNSTTSGKASDSSKKDSSSNPTTKAASHDHEVNRYSNEENAIKGLSEQYDRLNKAKDKAFGRSRIETIEAEIKKLKALKQASSNYLDAIVGNGNASKVAKALYNGEDIGKMIASGWVGGTVKADYNSLFSGLSASGKGLEYTAKDEAGNEWLVSDSYSLSKFNSTFGTNLQFNLDSYGNIQNKDAIYNLLQNLANTENDAYSKMANPTADSTTEYNKRMALLEEIKERIDQYGETADLLTEKTDEYLDYISSLQEKNAELITTKMEHGVNLGEKTLQKISRSLKILGDDIYRTAEGMSKWFNLTFEESVKANQQQADAYVEALKDAEQKINLYDQKDGQFNEDAIDPASAAEIFQSIEDGSDRLINDLLNDMEEGKEHFGKTLDYWNEKIERVNSAIEKNGDLLNHFQNILGLLGKNTDYQLMSKVIQGQLDNATSNYNTRKAEAQNAKEVYEKAQRGKEELIQLGVSDEALRVYEENTLQKALEDYQDKADKMYSALEKSIELSNQLFENEVNRIFAESEKRLAGKWGSFDALDSAMQRQQSVAEEYLTKTNQLYETNSMLRKLSQDIDKTDSSIAKAKLKAFSDEIAAMKTQEKLSKTDLEIAKARYEVLQAQIALEEAQNAKSTVRLQRDNEGNYGYVYTADQDKIADAEQKLEDKQNELYNLGLKKAEEYGQKIISIRKEWQAELKKIEEDFQNGIITSEEEYNLIVSDINQKYQALELSYMDTYTKANLLLNETGAEGQTEAWTNSFDEIISTQRVFSDDSESEANQLTNALNEQMNWLNDQREYYTEEAKVGNEELDDSIQEIIDTTKDLEQKLIGQNGLVDSMSKAMSVAGDLAVKFSNQYDSLKNLVEKYDSAARSAHELYNRTVDLIHAQVALNHANNNASAVSWGNGGTTATYFDGSTMTSSDTDGSSYNAGNGPQIDSSSNPQERPKIKEKVFKKWGRDNSCHWKEYTDGTRGSESRHHWSQTGTRRIPGAGWYIDYYCSVCSGKGSEFISDSSGSGGDINEKKKGYPTSVSSLKTGGYTGKWLASGKTGLYTGSWNGLDLEENGKLAFLHQKELVLNADDTENMLSAVKLIREISQNIDLQAISQAQGFRLTSGLISTQDQVLQQEVTIHAEFPNATDHNEIEEAFNNLINKATQYVNRY